MKLVGYFSQKRPDTAFRPGCLAVAALLAFGSGSSAFGACGTLNRTWSGSSSSNWNSTGNWSGSNVPNSASENAIIVATSRTPRANFTATIGCLDIQSGQMNTNYAGVALTITGDYFRNPTAGSLISSAGNTWKVVMGGVSPQTFENYDPLNYLDVTNNTSVTFTSPFELRNRLTLATTGTTLYVNANLTLSDATSVFTIPATTTVEVGAGVTLVASGGIVVAGALKVNPGATVLIGNGRTLQVSVGGVLRLAGAPGNVVSIDSNGGAFALSVAGAINASYFRIAHATAAGLDVTGTIQAMDHGEFHYLANAGYGVTLGPTVVVPATLDTLAFFDEFSYGNVRNINASAYNLSSVQVSNWSGGVGGGAYENDPNGKVDWQVPAPPQLSLSNATEVGFPVSPIGESSGPALFTTFAFALNQDGASFTDITELTLSVSGTATSSDIEYLQLFKDAAGGSNCVFDSGTDTQIGGNLALFGSPASGTIAIPGGEVRVFGTAPVCLHALVRTSTSAQNANTLAIQIAATSHVKNSQGYEFSAASGPPVSGRSATISANAASIWRGTSSTAWTTANNWNPSNVPSATRDCRVGSGTRVPALSGNVACRNAVLVTGGAINFSNAARELAAYGSLLVETGYTFTSAASGILAMRGASNQSLRIGTTFPGNLLIQNAGATGTNTVSVDANSTVTGTLTVNSGVLRIMDGITLSVGGNITVAAGAILEIEPGGTLVLGNGRTMTVNAGGTLRLIGDLERPVLITSTGATAAYSIVINGTIEAEYYVLSRLGTNGLTINAGATIDPTYHLQSGAFVYPVSNNSAFLRLFRQIPGNTLTGMTFDANGSAANNVTNIYTDASVPAGTLSIDGYTGSWAGPSYDAFTNYTITWAGQTNTLDLTREASGPATVNQGTTAVMGRFGFKQKLAGATYQDTEITELRLTLTGTGSAADITEVRLYYSTTCTNSGGMLLGAGTFSGSPATVTFSNLSGAWVQAHATAPPKRCIYVEYDVAFDALGGNTLGVSIESRLDVVNSKGYEISSSTAPPVNLGAAATIQGATTVWTGASSTAWCTAANWNAGVPIASTNCVINSAVRNPVISTTCGGIQPVCKSVTIESGNLTMNSGTELRVYGSFSNNGTFTQTGTATLRVNDNGASVTNQTLYNVAGAFGTVTFAKTAGGTVQAIGSNVSIANLVVPAGSNFEWIVPAGQSLALQNGLTLPAAKFTIKGGGTLLVPSGSGILVNGGTFRTDGVNDAMPQNPANKGKISTVSGSGAWSFSSTIGTLDFTGFILDRLDVNGLIVGGSTSLANFNGGQFTNLSANYAAVKPIQINTSGAVPAVAQNVGWNWGPENTPPASSQSYLLAYSSGCGGQTISFDQWFGDFFVNFGEPDTSTKVSASNCTINIAASSSPVSLLSFTAAAYDSAVVLNWETGAELDLQGFNILRGTAEDVSFEAINSELIRNPNDSGSLHGAYRFVDFGAKNAVQYTYYLQEIAINGAAKMHGPVVALPLVGKGKAPEYDPPVQQPATGSEPGIDLGNGVRLLSQTKDAIKIEVVFPAEQVLPALWNPEYVTLQMPGYTNTLEPGKPELPERLLFVDVGRAPVRAILRDVTIETGDISFRRVAPSPLWSVTARATLTPSWVPDADYYATSISRPEKPYFVGEISQKAGDRQLLSITLRPFSYNPVTRELRKTSRMVLDISLDAVQLPSLPVDSPDAGTGLAGEELVKIRYQKTGVYELKIRELLDAGYERFIGIPVDVLRAHSRGREIPLEVVSRGETFGPDDAIRFYAVFEATLDDAENELTLSLRSDTEEEAARIHVRNARPDGLPETTEKGSFARVSAEMDLYALFDKPLGTQADRFYWTRIYTRQGADSERIAPNARFDGWIDLPNLMPDAPAPVRLTFFVRGRGVRSASPTHHLRVYVNEVPFSVGELVFSEVSPVSLALDVPSILFTTGVNRVRIEALGDLLPSGEWSTVDLDRIEVEYTAYRDLSSGSLFLHNRYPDRMIAITGVKDPSDLVLYDTSDPENVWRLSDFTFSSSGDGSNTVFFAARTDDTYEKGRRFFAVEKAHLLKPSAIKPANDFSMSLRSVDLGADFLIIGPRALKGAVQELIDTREKQGLRTVFASVEQIYDEFAGGVVSAAAIRDAIHFVAKNWKGPSLRYLLFVGDSTYDPRNRLGKENRRNVMPMPIEKGQFADFGSDEWFITSETESSDSIRLPIAIGRMPAQDPAVLYATIQKILDYESGDRAPDDEGVRSVSFLADQDSMSEGFSRLTKGFAESMRPAGFSAMELTRGGVEVPGTGDITREFERGPLILTYLGHGAENLWADREWFGNEQAQQLRHKRLPIVLGLTCLNSVFYDADPTAQGLGETLFLNPEGGAVAFVGSTAMTSPSAQVAFANAFFGEVRSEAARGPHNARLGDLILRAKATLVGNAASQDVLKSYLLFGDPSMLLPKSMFNEENPETVSSLPVGHSGGADGAQRGGGGFFSCGRMNLRGGAEGDSGESAAEFALIWALMVGSYLVLRINGIRLLVDAECVNKSPSNTP